MLGYSVIQFFHPTHQMMSSSTKNGPVFTTSQLVQPSSSSFVEEEDVFGGFGGDEKDSGTSEEAPPEGLHCSPTVEGLFGNPSTWSAGGHNFEAHSENRALELVSLLTLCAESISTGNSVAVSCFLSRLGEMASPRGSPTQRVVAYFTEALAFRAVKQWPHVFSISPPREISDQIDEEEDAAAMRLLNQVSPIPRFLHFTMNERLLRAFEGKEKVHIVDFDIKEGLQWPSLLQSLASRPTPPLHVRVTGIGENKQYLQDTGARLRALAESLNLQFEFHPVVDRLEDVRLWMLHVKEGECVAVNCALQLHKALYDESRACLMNLLALIRSTNPLIVLVAEEEAEHNDPRWEVRFASSLKYYAAVFDSLDASLLPEESVARAKIEEMFARRIRNIVGCEAVGRVERHEKFDKWREMLQDGGFGCVDLGEREAIQSRMLLRMYPSADKYVIKEIEEGGNALTLMWSDQPLYTVSAWAPSGSSVGRSPSASQSG